MGPVCIEHERDHKFVAKDKEQKRPRCGVCGRGKSNLAHHGTPASLNVFASSRNEFVYLSAKRAWEERLTELMDVSGMEKPFAGKVLVEGEMCFPDRGRRDQGNYRFIIEKALGDALTLGGWLEDDDWSRYEFGNLAHVYRRGESWTRLMLFPAERVEPPPPEARRKPAPQDTALFAA